MSAVAVPAAHVAGIPLEEALLTCGPALLVATAAVVAWAGGRLRRTRERLARLRPSRRRRRGFG